MRVDFKRVDVETLNPWLRFSSGYIFPLLFQATATLYVPFNGIVRELMYEVDDTATKDQPLIMVEVEGEEEEGGCEEEESEGEWVEVEGEEEEGGCEEGERERE